MRRTRLWRHTAALAAILAGASAVRPVGQPAAAVTFARQILELSEPGGSFDTDNLISNERSYLHVIPSLRQAGVSGGAYVGVGPDQNFSYIAAVHPSVAFIIDVRRDNLLLQLLFKALFEISETRADYLSHLFGRRLRPPLDQWRSAPLEKIAAEIESAQPAADAVRALQKQVAAKVAGFGVPLSAQDLATIDRFHRTFIEEGLSLKFQSYGRAPRSYYPTYRELLFETDRGGRQANFLVTEDDYRFVRGLQLQDAIVPVVGNLAGPTALAAIGRAIRQRGETLSAFYVSNVELYLYQNGTFSRYADTVSALPHNGRTVLIRSIFSGPGVGMPPDAMPGYASASVIQRLDEFIADYRARKYLSYEDLLDSPH